MKLSEIKIIGESAMSDLHLQKTEALLDAIENEFGCDRDMCEKIADYMTKNEDSDEVNDFLYDHFQERMDYGTRKARDGDPANWIANEMEHLFGKLAKGL